MQIPSEPTLTCMAVSGSHQVYQVCTLCQQLKGVSRHLTQCATSTPTISDLIPPHDAEGPYQDTLADTMIRMKNSFRRVRVACYIGAGTTNCSNGP